MDMLTSPAGAALAIEPCPYAGFLNRWKHLFDTLTGTGRYSSRVNAPQRKTEDLSPREGEDVKAWFSRVVDGHYRFFFSTAFRVLRRAEEAEDAVQTGVMKALRRLDKLDEPKAVVGWIGQIVRNTALDMIRASKRSRTTDPDILNQTAQTPPETGLDADELAVLLEAIDQLPPSQADVVTLRHVEGLEVSVLSEQLGITPNAARVRLFRAYERLRADEKVRKACAMEDAS